MTNTCKAKNRLSVSAADDRTAQQQIDQIRPHHRHPPGHRRADAHAPVSVGIPAQDLPGEGHAQRQAAAKARP